MGWWRYLATQVKWKTIATRNQQMVLSFYGISQFRARQTEMFARNHRMREKCTELRVTLCLLRPNPPTISSLVNFPSFSALVSHKPSGCQWMILHGKLYCSAIVSNPLDGGKKSGEHKQFRILPTDINSVNGGTFGSLLIRTRSRALVALKQKQIQTNSLKSTVSSFEQHFSWKQPYLQQVVLLNLWWQRNKSEFVVFRGD